MSPSLPEDHTFNITGWGQDEGQLSVTVPESLRSPTLTWMGLPADSIDGLPSLLPYCEQWIDGEIDGSELLSWFIALLARGDDELRRSARVITTLALSICVKDDSEVGPNSKYKLPSIPFQVNFAEADVGSSVFKAALRSLMNVSTNLEAMSSSVLVDYMGKHICEGATVASNGAVMMDYGPSTARRKEMIARTREGCSQMLEQGIPPAVVFGGTNLDLLGISISAVLDCALAAHPARAEICTKAWRGIPLEDALLYRGVGSGAGWAKLVEYCATGFVSECKNHVSSYGALIAAPDTTDIAKDHGNTFDNLAAAYPEVDFQTMAHELAKEGSCAVMPLAFLATVLWQFFSHSHSGRTSPELLRNLLRLLDPAYISDGVSWRRATVKLFENGSLPGYFGPLGLPKKLALGAGEWIWDEERLYYRPVDFTPPAFSDEFVHGWGDRLQQALARFDDVGNFGPESA
ncbi:hypothetical protein ABW20_dc0103598 [Dactylellina cionopaga]|nr:hypothetical protein ABW20_dc0103598 [Dactylellina cionopaga]